MFCGHRGALLGSRGEQRSASECVGTAQQPAGGLVNGGDRLIAEQLRLSADDREAVGEVLGHLVTRQTLEQRASDYP